MVTSFDADTSATDDSDQDDGVGSAGCGSAPVFGDFFLPPKRKTRLRQTPAAAAARHSCRVRQTLGAAATASRANAEAIAKKAASAGEEREEERKDDGGATAAAAPAGWEHAGQAAPTAAPGSFFAPPRLAAAAAAAAGGSSGGVGAVAAPKGDILPPQSRSLSSAASRAAWKRRGVGGCSDDVRNVAAPRIGDPTEEQEEERDTGEETAEADGHFDPGLRRTVATLTRARSRTAPSEVEMRLGRRTSSGLYRPPPRLAGSRLDSTRCHWLLPPESLLNRVDSNTSAFLQRQWLGLSRVGFRDRAGAAGGLAASAAASAAAGRRPTRSVPARLHAGWLAQTLRPTGWLAAIPEGEERRLPMPASECMISEPDRGTRRPPTAAVERAILQELAEA